MMKIMKMALAVSGALMLLVLIGCPLAAMATPITGSVSFGGLVVANGPDFNSSTELSFPNPIAVEQVLGDFASLAGGAVTFYSFKTDLSFTPVIPQWEGGGFRFDLMTLTNVFKDANFLLLQGTGVLHGEGLDDTPGLWNFSANNLAGTFSFSAGTASAAVPEPTSLLLLGTGLSVIGLASWRRGR